MPSWQQASRFAEASRVNRTQFAEVSYTRYMVRKFVILLALLSQVSWAQIKYIVQPDHIVAEVTALQTNIPLTSSSIWTSAIPTPTIGAAAQINACSVGSTVRARITALGVEPYMGIWVDGTYPGADGNPITISSTIAIFPADGDQWVTLTGLPRYVDAGTLHLSLKSTWVNTRFLVFAPFPNDYKLYETYQTPAGPMSPDWTDLLDITCNGCLGDASPDAIVRDTTIAVNNLPRVFYDPGSHLFYSEPLGTYKLQSWCNMQKVQTTPMQCSDVAAFVQLCLDSQGVSGSLKRIMAAKPDGTILSTFITNPFTPIGANQSEFTFFFHEVILYGGGVYDAVGKLYIDPSSGAVYNKPSLGIPLPTYWQTLGTAGAVWGLAFCYEPLNPSTLAYQPMNVVQDYPQAPVPVSVLN